MATAYLLASVLTLIVVLVHGQEAFPEQGNIVVVAEDSFEDELNSFTDLILPGSANTRAECIQKKKCKNKGGTCQNKGNTCPGKFVKGCSKGCSCCLPEEISCKPSKRCKRANGACIARGECNGKIISTGCKKPRSCKKTHVCCVQDETTTEVPTCRGPSCPLPAGVCPDSITPLNFVCQNCETIGDANVWMNANAPTGTVSPSLLFAGKTFEKTAISYTSIGTKCNIKERVQAWDCTTNHLDNWSCGPRGFCTAQVEKSGSAYVPKTPITCTCPNPYFERKHVCTTGCDTAAKALEFVKDSGLEPTNGMPRGVFSGPLTYQPAKKQCLVNNLSEVTSWECIPNPTNKKEFLNCDEKGYCINLKSAISNGHFEYTLKACYKVHDNKKWDANCPNLKEQIVKPDTITSCMELCRLSFAANAATGCNAFNFKPNAGALCTLKRCPPTLPAPIPNTDNYGAYYYVPN